MELWEVYQSHIERNEKEKRTDGYKNRATGYITTYLPGRGFWAIMKTHGLG